MTDDEREAADANRPARRRQREQEQHERRDTALQQIREIIHSGNSLLALKAHQRMSRELPDWVLPQRDMLALIQQLQKGKLWAESVPLMAEYVSRYPQNSALVRLRLAEVLIAVERRPARALKVMAQIDESALDARHREHLRQLRAKATEMHEQDPYELADRDD